jgi:hypothetical protein
MEWNNIFCDRCVFSHVISSMLLTHEHMSVSSQFVNVSCECDFVNKKKSLWYIYATWQEYSYHMNRIFFFGSCSPIHEITILHFHIGMN